MQQTTPPKHFLNFFRWFCHPSLRNSIEGDLTELYNERCELFGKRKADQKFIVDVLLLFRPGIIKPVEGHQRLNNYGMFKNYFKVGIRNILKYKMFSFINVFGLAVAMAVCMLIILMLADQKGYDQFNEKRDRIYRVLTKIPTSAKPNASSPFPLASSVKHDYPIIEESTHLVPGVGGDILFNQKSAVARGFFADDAFFRVFDFKLEEGNRNTALTQPNSIVITKQIANILFHNESPIGKTIEFTNRGLNHLMGDGESTPSDWGSFTVTGVIDEAVHKSHIKFDILMSASSRDILYAEQKINDNTDNWKEYSNSFTYVVLRKDNTEKELIASLNDLTSRKYATLINLKGLKLIPQVLTSVTPGIFVGNPVSFSLPIEVYYFLAALAIAVMISAGVNYTNLSTARALTRAKEIGIRKVTGARRRDLIYQFLSESIIISFLSLALAMVLLLFIKPAFKALWVNRYLNFELNENLYVYAAFALFALIVGILAGTYPAFLLSKYQPLLAIQKKSGEKPNKGGIQKFLGTSQFIISLFFITTSILLYNQFKHHLAIDYGFNSKQIVNVSLQGNDYLKVSNEFNKMPIATSVSASDYLPATGTQNGGSFKIAGSNKDPRQFTILITDEKFAETMDLKIIAGRDFSNTSSNRFVLVNESTTRKWGYQHPSEIVGQELEQQGSTETKQVIGVIKDFRFRMPSEQEEIAPLMIQIRPSALRYVNIKTSSNDRQEIISQLENTWRTIDPIHPLSSKFYDEQLAETNQGFVDIVSIIGFIAFLAVTIACLGLLGMATYSVERRIKEIGVRKVLGAPELSIAFLLSKSFLKMIFVAIFFGAPISYLINNFWLNYLPNKVQFGIGTVLLATLILIVLGLITIGSQTLRASKNNPVDSLRMD